VPPLLLQSSQEWSAGQTAIRHQHHLGLGGNDRQQLGWSCPGSVES